MREAEYAMQRAWEYGVLFRKGDIGRVWKGEIQRQIGGGGGERKREEEQLRGETELPLQKNGWAGLALGEGGKEWVELIS